MGVPTKEFEFKEVQRFIQIMANHLDTSRLYNETECVDVNTDNIIK